MILAMYALAAIAAWIAATTLYAFVTAAMVRRAGLPVDVIGIGVGPRLWRYEARGTLHVWRLIPLGSYVKFPMGDDYADESVEASSAPRSGRQLSDLALSQKLLILVSGHAVVLLMGVALLAVAVMTTTPQLAACDKTQTMVQPCGMPGLRWETTPTTVAGQATLLRETGIEYIGRLLLFQPLKEWGGWISAIVTAGALGQQSFASWITAIELMWTLLGISNFLPLPCLAGYQILEYSAESLFGRLKIRGIEMLLSNLGLIYVLILHGRVMWLDVLWIQAQWF